MHWSGATGNKILEDDDAKNIETSMKNTYLFLGQYWMAALVAVATFSSTPGTSPLKMIPFTDSTLEIPYEM